MFDNGTEWKLGISVNLDHLPLFMVQYATVYHRQIPVGLTPQAQVMILRL
jgi:hypothetical protein